MTDEKAAVTVRWFFRKAAKGTTTSDLVARANRKKLAGKQWTSRTALRLLMNPAYAGRRPAGAPGMHAPIVTSELFERVQMLVEGRRTLTPTKRSEHGTDEQTAIAQFDPFRLRGLLTYGACGKVMSPAMSDALTSKLAIRLQRQPNAVPRVFAACCTAVVLNRKRDGREITLVPHSVLAEDHEEPGTRGRASRGTCSTTAKSR
jgi:hypothetical protein